MILQMGRVASISIHEAIRNDYNAYHTHGLERAQHRICCNSCSWTMAGRAATA